MHFQSLLDDDKQGNDDQTLHQKLVEAAIQGSIPLLSQTLAQNPNLLRSTIFPPPGSPLHVSALLGHVEFTKHLLTTTPDLSRSLDPGGSTPLHLASAKGNAVVVRELLSSDHSACRVLDRAGWSPIHAAAVKGRTEVLRLLLDADPAAVITADGESCLHLCVKYYSFAAMKVILESDDQLINWKDKQGNTVLHLAVATKQIEIVKYLLDTTRTKINARNANGLTPLDLLLQSPGDLRDLDIKDYLKLKHQESSTKPNTPKAKNPKHKDWLAKKRSALMIVSSLLATVAFQAGLSPPGGVWQSDFAGNPNGTTRFDRPHRAGQSVMAYTHPLKYGQYMIYNTVAFLCSLSIIMLQVSGLPMRQRRWMWVQMVIVWSAITAHSLSYFVTLINMTPKHVESSMYWVTRICVTVWLFLIGFVVIGNAAPVVMYLLRRYGYIRPQLGESRVYEEEEDDDVDEL